MTGYTWSVSSGGTITAGATANTITVTWNVAGTQQVNVNYTNMNGCSAAFPTVMTVIVNPSPTPPTIVGSASVCAGTIGITYTTEAGMTGYKWIVTSGGVITSGASTNAINVNWNTPGTQTVTVNYTNTSGCTAKAITVKNIIVNPLPVPTISIPDNTWIGASYIYSTEINMTSYNWIVLTGGIISSETGANIVTIKWLTLGWHTLSINYINENGCTSENSTIHKMKVINPPLKITEGISPNGDGINDVLIFDGIENYPGSKLIVFTREGKTVYESDDYRNDWDGKFLNNESKDQVTVISGTYYYVLQLGGTSRTIKGYIYIGY